MSDVGGPDSFNERFKDAATNPGVAYLLGRHDERISSQVESLPIGFRLQVTHAYKPSDEDHKRKPWHAVITPIPICEECGQEKTREWFKGSGESADEAIVKAFLEYAKIYGTRWDTANAPAPPAQDPAAGGNA